MRSRPFALALVAVAPIAHAQITSENDDVFGPNAITRDTAQGLDFLDLTLSENRSFSDVNGQFGPGGDFEGWRYATVAEVATLVNHWGFSPTVPLNPPQSTNYTGDTGADQLSTLVAMVGNTFPLGNESRAVGVTGDPAANPVARITITFQNYFDLSTNDRVTVTSTSNGLADASFGHWLVRAVPSPGTLALVPAGALALTRRRRR